MVYRAAQETSSVSGGIALIFFFSLGKGRGGDTHTHSGRTVRSQPGEEEEEGHPLSQIPPTKAVPVPWATENNSCRQTSSVWEAEPGEEGVGLDSDQPPVSL